MKSFAKCRYLLAWLLLFNASPVQSDTVTVSTFDWCPYICPESAAYPGLLVEYTRAIFERAGYEVAFIPYPWSRAIRHTATGDADALLAPARNETPDFIFPDTAIGAQRFCFFTRADDPWRYREPDSVAGRIILYPLDALPEVLAPHRDKARFQGKAYGKDYLGQSVKMLESGHIDTTLMTYYSMVYFLNGQGLSEHIGSAGCVSRQALYLAFSPAPEKADRVAILIAAFEDAIGQLRKEGYFEKLLKKYQLQ
ncbi:transporter substrate-binding domain-containing protein [Gallaecimonas sp. GXIMD4217]|uniref:substrate-binding periplasmic protein n=1 Tax=Gallaecimonas sp. GXIMD4217 TaxID=3131927 RepID=UPI00311AC097